MKWTLDATTGSRIPWIIFQNPTPRETNCQWESLHLVAGETLKQTGEDPGRIVEYHRPERFRIVLLEAINNELDGREILRQYVSRGNGRSSNGTSGVPSLKG
jgi:hypothetical protein